MLVPQLTDRLRDAENESMAKIAELEKQLSQARKELETLRVRLGACARRGWAGLPRTDQLGVLGLILPSTLERGWGSIYQACWWALTSPSVLTGAVQRVDPHGRLPASP